MDLNISSDPSYMEVSSGEFNEFLLREDYLREAYSDCDIFVRKLGKKAIAASSGGKFYIHKSMMVAPEPVMIKAGQKVVFAECDLGVNPDPEKAKQKLREFFEAQNEDHGDEWCCCD